MSKVAWLRKRGEWAARHPALMAGATVYAAFRFLPTTNYPKQDYDAEGYGPFGDVARAGFLPAPAPEPW